jgi:hypothetical protein
MSQPAPETEPACRLAELCDHIESLLDSDRLLPADGRALLEMLQKAQERVTAGDIAGAGGLLLGFESLLKALLDTGVLDPTASDLCLVAARVTALSLSETSA